MIGQRSVTWCSAALAGLIWADAVCAQDEAIEGWKRSTWQMTLSLDMPSLVPSAVQWAVLDEDPIPGLRARLIEARDRYQKRVQPTDDEARRKRIRSAQMAVSWDLGFRAVTGDHMYLLTSLPPDPNKQRFAGFFHSLSSNGPDGKKWVVTKSVRIKGEPVCWCIPVEVKTGESVQVSLTEKNMFDLETVFDETMRE